MRRKLIKQDAFDRIISESVNSVGVELVEIEPILSKAIGKDFLRLKSFTETKALYETVDGTYVHAGYELKEGHLTFNNVEELVIDESSTKEKRKSFLSEMIDSIIVGNKEKTQQNFGNYLGMVNWNESKKEDKDDKKSKFPFFKKKKDKDEDEDDGDKEHKKGKFPFFKSKKDKDEDEHESSCKHDDEKKDHLFKKAKKVSKEMAEAYLTSQNVLDYVQFMKVGPTLAESIIKKDEKGNVTNIKIPSKLLRNESKLQRREWKNLNEKVSVQRNQLETLLEDQEFSKSISNLKRQSSFADSKGLEESLESIVKNYPQVIYATQNELSQIISEALTSNNISNFDDKTCDFMAEGILRKAVQCFSEKASQILHLASAPKAEKDQDKYEHFQTVVESFYSSLDEKFGLERKVFADLYDSMGCVYQKANRQGNKVLSNETVSYLNDLADILNNKAKPDLDLAEEAASFVSNIIETNLESGVWVVSNTPHNTINGDHPEMNKKASKGYTPSSDFSGDYGDPAPAIGSDSMSYRGGKNSKEMRHNAWGQEGGSEVFPKLRNPYVPKPFGDYKIKAEKEVSDKDLADQSPSDTWPNLSNPYVPKEAGKSYKMKNGAETDLVVDR